MIISFGMTFKNEFSDNQSMLKSLHRVTTLILPPQYHLCFEFALVYSSQMGSSPLDILGGLHT